MGSLGIPYDAWDDIVVRNKSISLSSDNEVKVGQVVENLESLGKDGGSKGKEEFVGSFMDLGV